MTAETVDTVRERENHRQSWAREQIAELMRLARDNLTAQQIAGRLGRTEEAVQLKARQVESPC